MYDDILSYAADPGVTKYIVAVTQTKLSSGIHQVDNSLAHACVTWGADKVVGIGVEVTMRTKDV